MALFIFFNPVSPKYHHFNMQFYKNSYCDILHSSFLTKSLKLGVCITLQHSSSQTSHISGAYSPHILKNTPLNFEENIVTNPGM